jgi:flagellar biosynthesis anti-sigma factor FlgM
MKINSYGSDIRNQPLDGVGRPAAAAGNDAAPTSAPAAATGDQLQLSSDARLMETAMRAVQQMPDIRGDVVERMQALLAKGQIGNDPHALADTLIDRMLAVSPATQP